jgi:hypothetical protein
MSTYNEDYLWIKSSIESIINQTYKDLEFIIVVDNPVNEALKEQIISYSTKDKRIKVIINPENIGLVASLNKALDIAEGSFIARMDSDDISSFSRLEDQVNYIEKYNYDLIFSGVNIIDENGSYKFTTDILELNDIQTAELFKYGNISKHPTWMFRKHILDSLEGYRQVNYCEDYDFILRAIQSGYRVSRMPGATLDYRVRKSSISRLNLLKQFLYARKIRKLYISGKLNNFDVIKREFSKIDNKINNSLNSRFSKSQRYFNEGIELIKNKNIFKGIEKIIISFLICKYSILKMIDLFIYRLKRKQILIKKK